MSNPSATSTTTALTVANIPAALRPISHYIKVATDYSGRDVVIYYWCLYKAVEEAMKLDKSSPDSLAFITSILSALEQLKSANKENEAIRSEIVARAYIEDQAQKLFQYAEGQDMQSQFNPKMIKAFYTAGHLFDVIAIFEPLDENMLSARKYAKWRAVEVSQCLKNGQQPVPGSHFQQQQNTSFTTGGAGDSSFPGAAVDEDDEIKKIAESLGLPQVPKNGGGGGASHVVGWQTTHPHPSAQPQYPSAAGGVGGGGSSSSSPSTQQYYYPNANIGGGGSPGSNTIQAAAGNRPAAGDTRAPFMSPPPPSVAAGFGGGSGGAAGIYQHNATPRPSHQLPSQQQQQYPTQPQPMPRVVGSGYSSGGGGGGSAGYPLPPSSATMMMPPPVSTTTKSSGGSSNNNGSAATVEDYIEAKKYMKYAMSALDYEDANTSIQNLQKAISILQKQQPPQ